MESNSCSKIGRPVFSYAKHDLYVQSNSSQNPSKLFYSHQQTGFKLSIERQKNQEQTTPSIEGEEQSWKTDIT